MSEDEQKAHEINEAARLAATPATASEPRDCGEDSEGIMLRRLSDILTGGNASTWEQIVHAAEYHAACIKSSDDAMKEQT